MGIMRSLAYRFLRFFRTFSAKVPFKGYPPGGPAPSLDALSDSELMALNELLPWNAFTVDGHGRRFGNAAWAGKRTEPQPLPDPRVGRMNERFDLRDKHVLEIGCFEGIHTIALGRCARSVTAIDSRPENVVKTLVRAAFYGLRPHVFVCNVEKRPLPLHLLEADVVHHVGVLYHLFDPVTHLRELGTMARVGVMLDTHYCLENEATGRYVVEGKSYRFREYGEYGVADPFSGMNPSSKWLLLEDVAALLREAGFSDVEVVEKRNERRGPRALLFARKPPPGGGA